MTVLCRMMFVVFLYDSVKLHRDNESVEMLFSRVKPELDPISSCPSIKVDLKKEAPRSGLVVPCYR